MTVKMASGIIDAYCSAVGLLEKEKRRDLHVQGLHELGNLMWHTGSVR